jgi:hypothetical protein
MHFSLSRQFQTTGFAAFSLIYFTGLTPSAGFIAEYDLGPDND